MFHGKIGDLVILPKMTSCSNQL